MAEEKSGGAEQWIVDHKWWVAGAAGIVIFFVARSYFSGSSSSSTPVADTSNATVGTSTGDGTNWGNADPNGGNGSGGGGGIASALTGLDAELASLVQQLASQGAPGSPPLPSNTSAPNPPIGTPPTPQPSPPSNPTPSPAVQTPPPGLVATPSTQSVAQSLIASGYPLIGGTTGLTAKVGSRTPLDGRYTAQQIDAAITPISLGPQPAMVVHAAAVKSGSVTPTRHVAQSTIAAATKQTDFNIAHGGKEF